FFSVCRSLRPFFAFVFSQLVSFSAKGSSLLDRSGVANLGSIVSAFRYFLMVLRDKPVRRSISRIGKPCRKRSLRITFSSPMSITPLAPSLFAWGRVTWVKSQWKLRAYPGHFSVEINKTALRHRLSTVRGRFGWGARTPGKGMNGYGKAARTWRGGAAVGAVEGATRALPLAPASCSARGFGGDKVIALIARVAFSYPVLARG